MEENKLFTTHFLLKQEMWSLNGCLISKEHTIILDNKDP